MSERIKFEEWLKEVHLLESTWNEDRNCYNEYPAHLAYKAWQASRAVPDVPELVAVSHEVFYAPTREWRKTVEPEYYRKNGDLVRDLIDKSKAAKIIAAKDKEIERLKLRHTDEINDFILMGMARDEFKNLAEAAEAKLAQYEAQEPVAWVDENGIAAFTLGGISTVHTQFETSKSERFCFPLYASPAPASDLKAENERLREALTKISSPTQTAGLLWWQVEARAALNVESSHDKG